MVKISNKVTIPIDEISMHPIRAQGAGGQHVNKVATAVQLRFDINASSLPDFYKERLLSLRDRRISGEGVIVIKAQKYRSQDKNKEDALNRLRDFIKSAVIVQKKRKPTKPKKAAKEKRLESKTNRGRLKITRKPVKY
ncbi:alternative ribosome rescue aminoacyl-tRNA hydrolase ArfB [Candidatus Kuenenia sp.]|uniref:alternative ribosome rescue aminoacyl-tRNA hydrolase ArfB n=1 Tax=Candidatus Kuenenia sp. TaxID=2499824 RepID=UPI00321F95E0